ncbi:MAG: TetR/AcrR family transcriptional regulator [Clostridiales bacterium]|jgi:AcrR family transcriptional regulator|nr:TetR/AcrR family transcriptional regulator [Clostridiales bacterium]
MNESYPHSQKKLSKDSIFIALMKLLEKKSYNEITITQITKLAGVSRMAFYRNYQTKEDIIKDYVDALLHEFIDSIGLIEDAEKYKVTLLYFSFFRESKEFIKVLIKTGLTHIFYEQLCASIADLFKTQEDKIRDDPAITNYISQFIAAGLFRILMEWIKNGLVEEPEIMAAFVCEIT